MKTDENIITSSFKIYEIHIYRPWMVWKTMYCSGVASPHNQKVMNIELEMKNEMWLAKRAPNGDKESH